MFLSLVDKYNLKLEIVMVICIALFVVITVLFVVKTLKNASNKKHKDILFPKYDITETEKAIIYGDEKKKKTKGKFSLKKTISNFFVKKGWDTKIKSWYVQAGHYDKTVEDLASDTVKHLFIAILISLVIYFFAGNIWITLLLGIFAFSFPYLNLYGDIQDRRNAFRRDFPYFLQTLSFVLNNGSNMSVAFLEVVKKQNEGVLKDVMYDVVTTQRVNGGDFTQAFSSIIDKIKIDETREFVEIVQNNLEKGVSIAETFTSQSETISRFIKNKKTKKIKSISTKILIPILVIIVAIALLFI